MPRPKNPDNIKTLPTRPDAGGDPTLSLLVDAAYNAVAEKEAAFAKIVAVRTTLRGLRDSGAVSSPEVAAWIDVMFPPRADAQTTPGTEIAKS